MLATSLSESLNRLVMGTQGMDFLQVTAALSFSLFCSLLICFTYKRTHTGGTYSQSFLITLVMISMITGVIMLIIGSNIARAFSLVGALSIIRFRTAVKDTKDVAFVFFAIAVGMACGTQFFGMGVVFTLILCLVLFILKWTNFGAKTSLSQLLTLEFPATKDKDKELHPLLKDYCRHYHLINVENANEENTLVLSYSIIFINQAKTDEFLQKLREKSGKVNLSLVSYDTRTEV